MNNHWGEFSPAPDGERRGLRTLQGRQLFLEQLDENCPEVIRELFQKVFPVYQKELQRDKKEHINNLNPVLGRDSALEKVLLDWADRWRLNEDWILQNTLRTLAQWARALPSSGDELEWWYPPLMAPRPEVPEPPGAWNPLLERKSAYLKRCKKYIEKVDIAHSRAGFTHTPKKDKIEKHMNWLVKYQVLGEEPADIAEGNIEVRTVRYGIRNAADLIGLEKR